MPEGHGCCNYPTCCALLHGWRRWRVVGMGVKCSLFLGRGSVHLPLAGPGAGQFGTVCSSHLHLFHANCFNQKKKKKRGNSDKIEDRTQPSGRADETMLGDSQLITEAEGYCQLSAFCCLSRNLMCHLTVHTQQWPEHIRCLWKCIFHTLPPKKE